MKILKLIAATVAGLIAGGMLIAGIEMISSRIYPMPEGLNLENREEMRNFIGTLPAGAFLIVMAAWLFGAFGAAAVARRLAPQGSVWPPLVAGLLLGMGAIVNLVMLPHPVWFAVLGLVAMFVGWIAGLIVAAPKSMSTQCEARIRSPIDRVFQVVSSPEVFAKAVPGIEKIEFVSGQKSGPGARFRETRTINNRTGSTELAITELSPNQSVRIESLTLGAVWSTLTSVRQDGDFVRVTMETQSTPRSWYAHLLVPMILRMIGKAIESDLKAVKDYCERANGTVDPR